MADLGKIFEGLAVLLWPIIESAKSRKFTLKIGGQELTMEEANKQQQLAIEDLRSRILELENAAQHPRDYGKASVQTAVETHAGGLSILWVDDNPILYSLLLVQ